MAESSAAGQGGTIAHESARMEADLNTQLPPSAPKIANSTAIESSAAAEDPLLSLSPDDILAALRDADAISTTTADQHASAITRGIRDASATERALGLRAAGVGSKTRAWCAELAAWSWTGSFTAPDHEASRAAEGTMKEGSVPAAVVAEREARIEAIRDEMEALDIEELKDYVRSVHTLPNSRGSSLYEVDLSAPSMVQHLDDFTALLTGTILGTLPYIHQLNRLMNLWSIRLLVLHQVPGFLESLWSSRTAVDSAWNAIKPDGAAPGEKPELSKQAYDTMHAVLEPRVSHLARVIDSMLDSLEGQQDTLPDEWIDLMEAVQADYEEWAIMAQRLTERSDSLKDHAVAENKSWLFDSQTETSSDEEGVKGRDPSNGPSETGNTHESGEAESPLSEAYKTLETSFAAAPPLLPPRSPLREQPSESIQERNALPSNSKIGNQIPGYTKAHPASFMMARQQQASNEGFDAPQPSPRTPAPLLMPDAISTSNSRSRSSSPPHSATSSSFVSDISEPQIMEASPIQVTAYSPTRGSAPPEFLSRRDSEQTVRSESTLRGSVDLGESKESSRSGSSLVPDANPVEATVQQRVRNIMIKRNDSDPPGESYTIPEATEEEEHPSMLEDEYADSENTGSEYADSEREPSPAREPRTLEEQLTKRIRSIITSIPGRIQLASTPGHDGQDAKSRMVSGQSRNVSGHSIPPLRTKHANAGITLAPAFEKKASPKVHSGTSDIKVYHLLQPEKEKPIKLYVRLVGDEERVMVRVGGGWADLETYLRAYAVHHSGRVVSGTRPEPKAATDTLRERPSFLGNDSGMGWDEAPSQPESPMEGRSDALVNHKVRNSSAKMSPRTPEGIARRGDSLVPGGYFDGLDFRRLEIGGNGNGNGKEAPGVGLGGIDRNVELSPTKQAWVEGMLSQATRQASGEVKKRPDFGDLGKAGATRRVFMKGKAAEE